MKRRFTILTAALALLVSLAIPMGMWGQTVSENNVLWTEPFGGNPSSATQFTETTSWDNYINPTTFVDSDASLLSYISSNAMANSGTATNMDGAHVWLNKSVDSYIQISGIKLYNTTKVKVSWAQATSASLTTVYYQFDGTGDFTQLSSCSGPNANFVSDELSVENHTTIALKFFHPKSNAKNTRIDNLTLTATEVSGGTPTCATPTFSPAAGAYTSAQNVEISTTTEGTTIYYTTDGNDPTTASSVYSTAIPVSTNTTIKAMAVKANYNNSAVASATYTFEVPSFNQDWEGAMHGWTFVSVSGDQTWSVAGNSSNHYAKMSGYANSTNNANEDWCISPAFDLGDYSNPVLTFETAKNYNGNNLEVYFSNDYDGTNPTTATWAPLSCTLSPGNNSWAFISSGDIDLSSYSGSNCFIGFKYTSTSSAAATWEVDNIELEDRPVVVTHSLAFCANPAAAGTVTVDNSTTSPVTINEGATVNISATPNSGYTFSGWTVSGTGSSVADATNASTTFTMGTADATLTANFTAIPTWDVTYHANGGTGDDVVVSYNEGDDVTVADNTFTRTGYVFVKWNTMANGNGTDYAPGDVIVGIDDDIDLYAQWEERNEVADCMDRAFTGVTNGSTSYKDWTGTGATGVSYSGNSAGSNDAIQLRSTNPSGIVSTTSGGKVMKVEVSWQSNTSVDRVLQVYGSNNAYTAPSELYATSTQGTLLGTIVNGTSTSLNITGDYEYVGLRSASGAMYLSSICITWGSASALAAPAIAPATPTFVGSQEITITAPEGASIRYTLDGTEPTATTGTLYDGPFTITTTTTVKAIAYNETSSSQVTAVTYTRVYNITLVQPTGGVISASPMQAAEGAEITLAATANVGYSFGSWSVNDGAVSVSNNTFAMPASDVTVTATFSNNVTTYTISFSVNDKVEMTATVNNGTSIDLTKFVADVTTEGYIFEGWSETQNGNAIANQGSYMPSGDITLYPGYRQATTGDYTLVTDDSQLVAGNLVVIAANGDKNWAMSTTQNDNNRGVAEISKSGNTMTIPVSITEDVVCELLLGNIVDGGSTYWTFYDATNSGYLYAASSNKNWLRTQTTNDDNGEWTIVVASNGEATITAHGNNTNNILRYNPGSVVFSCYSTGQQTVWLYTKSTAKSSKGNRENIAATSKVTGIAENVLVTVKNGGVVYLTGANAGNASNLVVEDGGQLISTNDVEGTMLKSVTGFVNNNNKGHYYFISSPFTSATSPMNVRNMINTDGYDLYYFDQTRELEWITYKEGGEAYHPGFNLVSGKGYLYANKESNPLEFAGTLRKGMNDNVMNTYTINTLVYDSDAEFAGWNLVGNPFTSNVTVSKAFYKMNNTSDGVNTTAVQAGGMIAPMEGVFVLAENAGDKNVVFAVYPTTPNKSRSVNVNVAREGEFLDRAIVTMGEGRLLNKLYLSENTTTISIPQDGNDYAIVPSNGQNEMPVRFKASRNANYTISIDAENVEMNYLHLIDNMTGADVDLLQTPSYNFEARTTDYANRFKLVFATGDNSNDDNFAFFSNGSFVINNEGNAELQVIDITGRIVKSESINGCTNVNVNAAAGVYMLRLINGDNVKVQKVVVK